MEDREPIDYYSRPHLRLAEKGIFIHKLRGTYTLPKQAWKLDVLLTYPSPIDLVKQALREYLVEMYAASNVVFLQRRSDRENQFYVQFDRGDI